MFNESYDSRSQSTLTNFFPEDSSFKIVLLGDYGVGKSSVLLRYSENIFISNQKSEDRNTNTNNEYTNKKIIFPTGYEYKLQIWDTGGQEKYSSLTKTYLKGVLGIILIFDITNQNSFENLTKWIDYIKTNINSYHIDCGCNHIDNTNKSNNFFENVPLVLLGNKKDLENLREVKEEDVLSFAAEYNVEYFEISAKNVLLKLILRELILNILLIDYLKKLSKFMSKKGLLQLIVQ